MDQAKGQVNGRWKNEQEDNRGRDGVQAKVRRNAFGGSRAFARPMLEAFRQAMRPRVRLVNRGTLFATNLCSAKSTPCAEMYQH